MTVVHPGVFKKYSLGPVQPWVEKAAYFLGSRHNIRTIYGWRKTDTFPDHPSGHAIDLMVPDKATGDAVAQDAINNAGSLGVSYVIWNHQVWNSRQGWHPYTSTSNPHTDHVHITMWNAGSGVGLANNTGVPTRLIADTSSEQPSDVDTTCAWHVHLPLAGDSCLAHKSQVRAGLAVLVIGSGVGVSLIGMALLIVYGLKQSGVARDMLNLVRIVR